MTAALWIAKASIIVFAALVCFAFLLALLAAWIEMGMR